MYQKRCSHLRTQLVFGHFVYVKLLLQLRKNQLHNCRENDMMQAKWTTLLSEANGEQPGVRI